MKQSSIEFLMEKLFDPSSLAKEQIEWFEQAKAMHKDEIENAYWDGGQWVPLAAYQCEDYYNETFSHKEE